MSTVQDILDLMQYRVDYKGSLLPTINQSVRLIAKRLYWFNSGLLKTPLVLPIAAPTSYAASTIGATSATNPNTFTDSANGFLTAGMEDGHSFVTTSTVNPGPYRMKSVAAGVIEVYDSESLTTEAEGSSITLTMQNEWVDLPSDFWGLCTGPEDDLMLSEMRRQVLPLPDPYTAALYQNTAGIPLYYEILGTKLYMYPSPESKWTLTGRYFSRPTKLTATSSTIPFNEMFDDIIAEYTVAAHRGEPLKVLQGMINEAVDSIISKYDKAIPQEPVESIRWNQMEG